MTLSRAERLILCLLPALAVSLALWVKIAKGPFWLGSNSDPEYAYLLNSLSLAMGKMPALSEHPGTTLLEFGAFVLRTAHLFFGRGEIVNDVLTRPEFYLNAMCYSILAFFFAAQVALGWIARRCGFTVSHCLLLQAAPFVSMTSIETLACVKPEAFMQPVAALLALSVVLALEKNWTSQRGMAVAMGVIVAAGVVAKATFLPLLAIPMCVLATWRARAMCLASFALACGIFLLPIYKLWRFMAGALWDIATHTGARGTGAAGVVDTGVFMGNLLNLLKDEWLTALIFFAGLIVWTARFFSMRNSDSEDESASGRAGERAKWERETFALLGVNVALAVQFLLVAKHPGKHYPQPGLSLAGLNLFLIFRCASHWLIMRTIKCVSCVAVAFLMTCQTYCTTLRARNWRAYSLAQMSVVDLREQQGEAKVIYHYRSSSLESALAFGNGYAGGRFNRELQRLYPRALFYSLWHTRYHNFNEDIFTPETVFQWAASEPVFMQGSPFEGGNAQYRPANAALELVSPMGPEVLYRLRSDKAIK